MSTRAHGDMRPYHELRPERENENEKDYENENENERCGAAGRRSTFGPGSVEPAASICSLQTLARGAAHPGGGAFDHLLQRLQIAVFVVIRDLVFRSDKVAVGRGIRFLDDQSH